nr:60S ribosomal protein L30 [Ipomoea batatas]
MTLQCNHLICLDWTSNIQTPKPYRYLIDSRIFVIIGFIDNGDLRQEDDNVDLGTACGKYFRVSCLSIIDPGDSDIIKPLPGEQ